MRGLVGAAIVIFAQVAMAAGAEKQADLLGTGQKFTIAVVSPQPEGMACSVVQVKLGSALTYEGECDGKGATEESFEVRKVGSPARDVLLVLHKTWEELDAGPSLTARAYVAESACKLHFMGLASVENEKDPFGLLLAGFDAKKPINAPPRRVTETTFVLKADATWTPAGTDIGRIFTCPGEVYSIVTEGTWSVGQRVEPASADGYAKSPYLGERRLKTDAKVGALLCAEAAKKEVPIGVKGTLTSKVSIYRSLSPR